MCPLNDFPKEEHAVSILDELREAIFAIHADDALFINDRAELDPLGADYIPEARVTAAIDQFEAAHPGLIEIARRKIEHASAQGRMKV